MTSLRNEISKSYKKLPAQKKSRRRREKIQSNPIKNQKEKKRLTKCDTNYKHVLTSLNKSD